MFEPFLDALYVRAFHADGEGERVALAALQKLDRGAAETAVDDQTVFFLEAAHRVLRLFAEDAVRLIGQIAFFKEQLLIRFDLVAAVADAVEERHRVLAEQHLERRVVDDHVVGQVVARAEASDRLFGLLVELAVFRAVEIAELDEPFLGDLHVVAGRSAQDRIGQRVLVEQLFVSFLIADAVGMDAVAHLKRADRVRGTVGILVVGLFEVEIIELHQPDLDVQNDRILVAADQRVPVERVPRGRGGRRRFRCALRRVQRRIAGHVLADRRRRHFDAHLIYLRRQVRPLRQQDRKQDQHAYACADQYIRQSFPDAFFTRGV